MQIRNPKVAQFNWNGIKRKMPETSKFMQDNNWKVGMFQDTHLKTGTNFTASNCDNVRHVIKEAIFAKIVAIQSPPLFF